MDTLVKNLFMKNNEIKNILPDGSIEGETFSGKDYKGEHPRPKDNETYAEYRARVDECKANGFNLGDLSWSNWTNYCMGSGSYEGVDSNDIIE